MKDQEYELLGLKIKVMYVDNECTEDGNWVFGTTEYIGDTDIIKISTKDRKGNPMSKESMTRTLRHELFHVILCRGQYFNSSDDEPLVEWLALCTDILNKLGLKI